MSLAEGFEADHLEAQQRMGQLGYYYRWILNRFTPFVGSRIWDAGAGVGHVASLLADKAELLLVTEYTEENLNRLKARFAQTPRVEVRRCDLLDEQDSRFEDKALDTIITLDVLEHLEDDQRALASFYRNLPVGGHLLVKVPAHPFLFGTMDEASLHFRRYSKRELKQKLQAAGFEVKRIGYMNMVAVAPYLLKGRILKRRGNFSREIDPSKLALYNRLMPWFERIEKLLPVPFGLSLIAVAEKGSEEKKGDFR